MIDKTPEQIIAKAKERGELFGGNANGNPNYVVFTLDEFKAYTTALTAAPQPAQAAEPDAWRITDGEGGYDYLENEPTPTQTEHAHQHGRKFEELVLKPVAQPAPATPYVVTDEDVDAALARYYGQPSPLAHGDMRAALNAHEANKLKAKP